MRKHCLFIASWKKNKEITSFVYSLRNGITTSVNSWKNDNEKSVTL